MLRSGFKAFSVFAKSREELIRNETLHAMSHAMKVSASDGKEACQKVELAVRNCILNGKQGLQISQDLIQCGLSHSIQFDSSGNILALFVMESLKHNGCADTCRTVSRFVDSMDADSVKRTCSFLVRYLSEYAYRDKCLPFYDFSAKLKRLYPAAPIDINPIIQFILLPHMKLREIGQLIAIYSEQISKDTYAHVFDLILSSRREVSQIGSRVSAYMELHDFLSTSNIANLQKSALQALEHCMTTVHYPPPESFLQYLSKIYRSN